MYDKVVVVIGNIVVIVKPTGKVVGGDKEGGIGVVVIDIEDGDNGNVAIVLNIVVVVVYDIYIYIYKLMWLLLKLMFWI